MKRVILTIIICVLTVSGGIRPLLIESYQEDQITIPAGENDTLVITEVSFLVDTACYVQFASGGIVQLGKMGMELDGVELPPLTQSVTEGPQWFNITYTYLVETGEHVVELVLMNERNDFRPSLCKNAYLQALIFLPDTGSAVAEQPTGDAEPLNTPSLVSSGPYVNVQGATELVDASGRVIEDAIEDDKVYITNLPTGTYFARDGEQTVVKIVKVE